MKNIFFLVLTTLAFSGCESPKTGQKNTLFCYVRYDESVKEIKAEAIWQDTQKKNSIEIPGGIQYQGAEMRLLPVNGVTYRYDQNIEFQPEHSFEWRAEENTKQQFKMHIDPIKVFAFNEKSVSTSHPATLQWEGSPLGKGETIVFMWENSKKGLTKPMEVSTTSSKPLIDFPAAKLKDLSPGDWTLYLVRKKLCKDTIGALPVNGIIEYYTKAMAVKVIE